MEDRWFYNGMQKQNLKCYFDKDFRYVEEFDTEDDAHHIWKVEPKNWNRDILEAAVQAGILDEKEWTPEILNQAFQN